MKSKLDRNEKKHENENNKRESQTQKLLTEFTPFTGLRLRVPLQWVPIQLMAFKMVQNISGISEHQLRQQNNMLYRSLQDLLSENYQMAFKKTKKPINTENGRLQKETTLEQVYSKNALFCSPSLYKRIQQLFKTECWTNSNESLLRPLALSPLALAETLGYKGAGRGFNPDLGALDFISARFLITNR
jgi:hypothetical protein